MEEQEPCWDCHNETEHPCHLCGCGLCLNCRTWMAPGAYGHGACVNPKEPPERTSHPVATVLPWQF